MARRRRFAAVVAVPLLALSAAVPIAATAGVTPASGAPARAAAAGPPTVIGVDNAAPGGKNWTYTHYFPETGVSVAQGGVILFKWNTGSQNGLHTVTLVPNGSTEAQVRQADPTALKDTTNGESDVVIPSQTFNGTSGTCGNSPTAPPCVFDGTTVVNSGVIPTTSGAIFPVQVAASTAPGTYHYICLIHPGMAGDITVVAAGQPATSPAALATQAANEYNQLTADASAAEAAANVPTSTANADGSRTWTVKVGVTVNDVDLLEFLPAHLAIRKGDSVNYDGSATTQEVHTVTTFAGFAAGFGALGPGNCEVAGGPDTQAKQVNGPPSLGCANPATYEQPLNISNQGEQNAVTSGATATSDFVSGRADTQALGASVAHTYKFPNNGRFALVCSIHNNMGGIVEMPGYRVASSTGAVSSYGAADPLGSKTSGLTSPVVALPSTFDHQGYWQVTADGHTYNFGSAQNVGNIGRHNGSPIVGAVATSDGGGLWLAARDGRVYALGDAAFMGDSAGGKLGGPIVGIDSDGSNGYDLVGSDGGVLTFGNSGSGNGGTRFFGSLGGKHLNAPIVGIADTILGNGYYLVAADGGVFTFGDAVFAGSLGALKLNAPIVGIGLSLDLFQPAYRLVAADGGVFTFGSTAPFLGSAAPVSPRNSAVAIN